MNAASSPAPAGTHGSPRARKWSKVFVPTVVGALLIFSLVNVYITMNREQLPEVIEGLRVYPGLVDEVVEGPIAYDTRPPYGGPNAGVIQDCGQYRVPVKDEHAAASLAVGAVWIAYNPNLPEEEIDAIHAHASGELYVIVAPYPELRAPIVLSAWGAQLDVESPLDVRIQAFIRDFAENPDVPRPHQSCSGGFTIPQ